MNDTRLRHIISFLLMAVFIIPIFAGHTDYLLGGSLIVKEDKTDRLLFDGGYAKAERIGDTIFNQRDRYCFKNQTFWMKSEVF